MWCWGLGGRTHVDLLKMSIFYTHYTGAKIRYFKEVDYECTPNFEGDPTISKIGNVPLQNIQRMGPHPKPLWIRHPIIYI